MALFICHWGAHFLSTICYIFILPKTSMELGQNRSYIQAISSGRSMPSMKQFLNICEYFEITPLQFFDAQENNPQLIKKALDGMRKMSDDDLIMLIGFISRLNTEN